MTCLAETPLGTKQYQTATKNMNFASYRAALQSNRAHSGWSARACGPLVAASQLQTCAHGPALEPGTPTARAARGGGKLSCCDRSRIEGAANTPPGRTRATKPPEISAYLAKSQVKEQGLQALTSSEAAKRTRSTGNTDSTMRFLNRNSHWNQLISAK